MNAIAYSSWVVLLILKSIHSNTGFRLKSVCKLNILDSWIRPITVLEHIMSDQKEKLTDFIFLQTGLKIYSYSQYSYFLSKTSSPTSHLFSCISIIRYFISLTLPMCTNTCVDKFTYEIAKRVWSTTYHYDKWPLLVLVEEARVCLHITSLTRVSLANLSFVYPIRKSDCHTWLLKRIAVSVRSPKLLLSKTPETHRHSILVATWKTRRL